MADYLPFLIIGLTTGSVYGLAGTGLVLTYKTSGIFNFAYGSLASISVFVFYFLYVQHGWPFWLAVLISVVVLGPLMGLALELLARTLAGASDVLKIAATIGIVIVVLAVGDLWYGSAGYSVPSYLPISTAFRVFGVNVGWDQVIVFAISLGATVGLCCFLRYARLGSSMRAVVDDASLVAMTGDSPTAIRRWAWVIGATFAALSGILLAPSLSLNGIILTELVVQAFGAAAIGYFSNLPLTYIGGLLIGVLSALATKFVVQIPSLAGLPPGLPFIILFLVLIFTPRARLAVRRYVPDVRLPDPYYAPQRIQTAFAGLVLLALTLVPFVVGTKLAIFSGALIDVILFISLGLLVRVSGQVSLCQYAFAAVGAASMAHFCSYGIPWFLSLVLAGLLAVIVGAIISIPAIRLSGVFLALATLGFGILLEQMFYTLNIMFGPTTSGIPTPRPDVAFGPIHLGTDRGFYYVILIFTALASTALIGIMRNRLGRILRAMSESPLALTTLGTTVNVGRVLVFCISAFLAAVAGGLTASQFHYAVGSEFSSFSSLILVALIAIIPVGAPWFAFIAAAGYEILPAYIDVANISDYTSILFGVSALVAPITLSRHPGMPKSLRRLLERIDGALPRRAAPQVSPTAISHRVHDDGLAIEGLTVSYGGALAVDQMTIVAPVGSITGLIGPNGAGKTTVFNAACGLLKPAAGRVLLHGKDVSSLSPAARARLGLGRTFQRVQLFDSLTVRQNVEMGREAHLSGCSPVAHLFSHGGDKSLIQAASEEAIELTGIEPILNMTVADISTGQRRLVELARVFAGPFDMVLLDEPSSGLDQHETADFGSIINQVVEQRGIGILIVEHDMALVRQVCDRVSVLDFGRLIFEGSVGEMLASDAVQAAYLGSDEGTGGLKLDRRLLLKRADVEGDRTGHIGASPKR